MPVLVPDLPTTTRHGLPWRQTLVTTATLLLLIAAWDLSGLNLVMARRFGSPTASALRDHWPWSTVLHEGARRVAWALQLVLLLAVWWPFGVLRRLGRPAPTRYRAASPGQCDGRRGAPQATRQILSMLVPPGAPIGSPQVMA